MRCADKATEGCGKTTDDCGAATRGYCRARFIGRQGAGRTEDGGSTAGGGTVEGERRIVEEMKGLAAE